MLLHASTREQAAWRAGYFWILFVGKQEPLYTSTLKRANNQGINLNSTKENRAIFEKVGGENTYVLYLPLALTKHHARVNCFKVHSPFLQVCNNIFLDLVLVLEWALVSLGGLWLKKPLCCHIVEQLWIGFPLLCEIQGKPIDRQKYDSLFLVLLQALPSQLNPKSSLPFQAA